MRIKNFNRFIKESLDDESQGEVQFWNDVYEKFTQVLDVGHLGVNQNIVISYIGKENYQVGVSGDIERVVSKKRGVNPQKVIACDVYSVTVILDDHTDTYITVDAVVEPSRKVWWRTTDGKSKSMNIHDESEYRKPQKILMRWTYYGEYQGSRADSGIVIPDIDIEIGTSLHSLLDRELEMAGIFKQLEGYKVN